MAYCSTCLPSAESKKGSILSILIYNFTPQFKLQHYSLFSFLTNLVCLFCPIVLSWCHWTFFFEVFAVSSSLTIYWLRSDWRQRYQKWILLIIMRTLDRQTFAGTHCLLHCSATIGDAQVHIPGRLFYNVNDVIIPFILKPWRHRNKWILCTQPCSPLAPCFGSNMA